MIYIRIRSWHVLRTWTRVPGRAVTLCGRSAEGETRNELPAEKSCESCLRAVARRDEQAEPEDDTVPA